MDASVDGVLGGYGHVNEADIGGSEAFLSALLSERLPNAGTDSHLVALGTNSLPLSPCVSSLIISVHLLSLSRQIYCELNVGSELNVGKL